MKRRIFVGAALAGCTRRKPSSPIRVQASQFVYTAPLYLALEAGYFQQEGLPVEIEQSDGSRTSIPLLAGGKSDVAFASPSPQLVNALGRGARIRVVAGRMKYSQACGDGRSVYGSRKAFPGGFTDFRQLKGKSVAVEARVNIQAYAFHVALKSAGLTREDVRIVKLEDRVAAAMLAAGKIDVSFVANTPIQMMSFLKNVVKGPSFASILPGFTYGYVVFGRRLLDEAPEDGTRFLRAFLRGSREYVAGRNPKFLLDLAKKGGMDEQLVLNHCRNDISLDGAIPEREIQAFIDWGVAEGHITSPVRAEDVIDKRFLREVKSV